MLQDFVRGRVVYPVSFEDPSVDLEAYYHDRKGGKLLIISSGGDNALAALSAPDTFTAVVAVDSNPAQIYLLELKAAIVKCLSHAEALGIFSSRRTLLEHWPELQRELSPPAVQWWRDRLNRKGPRHNLLTSDTMGWFARLSAFLARVLGLSLALTLLEKLWSLLACYSKTFLWACGVPTSQYELTPIPPHWGFRCFRRYLADHEYLKNTYILGPCLSTDFEWTSECSPPWLENDDNFQRAKGAICAGALTCRVASILDAEVYTPDITHINVLDAMDWMRPEDISTLLLRVRESSPSARVCWRSVAAPRELTCHVEHLLEYDLAQWDGGFACYLPWRPSPSLIDRVNVWGSVPVNRVGSYTSVHRARLARLKDGGVLGRSAMPPTRPAITTFVNMCLHALFGATRCSLQDFYADQAADYDDYRSNMLWGNLKLLEKLPLTTADLSVYMPGGGTAWLLEALGYRVSRVLVRDVASPMLAQAVARGVRLGWPLAAEQASAEDEVGGETFDLVMINYALSMMRDPHRCIKAAWLATAPGGILAVSDFTEEWTTNRSITSALCMMALKRCHVQPDARHLDWILELTGAEVLMDHRGYGAFPFVPFIRMPWYAVILRKLRKTHDSR
jgi:SAM-dependent methyltransferase